MLAGQQTVRALRTDLYKLCSSGCKSGGITMNRLLSK